MPEPDDQLPKRLSDDLDRRLDEFDATWNDGTAPELERFVPQALRTNEIPVRPQWRRYVAELLTIDIEYRVRQSKGQASPRVEDYYGRIPWLIKDDVVLREIIPAEYMARHTYGDRPGIGEYQLRFPHLGDTIAVSLEEADTDLVLEDSGTAERETQHLTDSFSAVQVTITDAAEEGTVIEGDDDHNSPPAKGLTRIFGDYELQREIARGGMGIVYKAVQRSLKRTVALKVILAGQFAQMEDVRRFHSEAEAAARLDHPNIVPIYEVGRVEGNHFFSMAYVDGPSLAAEVAEQPIDPARAALIIRDVADAIDYAHQHDVIHRDLKPANVLLEGGRTPRVTDFGLARQTNVESGVTVTGQILGTPSYMPPEQALGHMEQVDARSDVYSLGATMYCLLTGRAPFQAANIVQTLAQVVQDDPVSLRRLNSDIPRDLENICLKCLSKSPDARYQTAAALRDDLNRYLSGTPTVARPLSSTERVLRFCRRKPGVSALIALSTLLLVTLAAGSTGFYFKVLDDFHKSEAQRIEIAGKEEKARIEEQKAITASQEAVEQQGEAEAARDEERATRLKYESALRQAEFNIYLNTLQRIQQLWEEGQVERARELHDQLPDLTLWDELHGWEWNHVSRLLHQEQRLINAHSQPILDACWSPDGRLIATAGQDRLVKLWSSETGHLHATLTGHRDWVWTVRFIGDGSQLLSLSRDGTVRLWNVGKGVLIDVAADGLGSVETAAISGDGRRWAWADGDGTARVRDLDSKSEAAEWKDADARITAIALDHTGTQIALADAASRSIIIRRPDGDGPDVTLTNDDGAPLAMAFSPDGERLAAGGSSDRVQVWNTQTGRRLSRWTAHRGSIYGVQFGQDPDQLLTCSEDQTIRLWSISDESTLDTFRGHTGAVFGARMKPTGSDVLSAGDDGTVRLWRPGRDQLTLPDLSHGNVSPSHVIFPTSDSKGLQFLAEDALHQVMFHQAQVTDTIPLNAESAVTNVIPLSKTTGTFGIAAGRDVSVCDSQGGELTKLPRSQSEVRLLCGNENGSQLAAADLDGNVCLFDVETSAKLWEHEFDSRIAVITFCNDDRHLLAIDIDGAAVLFDAANGEAVKQSRLADSLRSVSVSPTQPIVALGGSDGAIRLHDLNDLSPLSVLRGHQGSVLALRFHPDGRRLASAGSDRSVRIWAPEVRTWAPDQEALLLTLQGHQRAVQHVFWSTGGDGSLISVDRGSTAIRWRTRNAR